MIQDEFLGFKILKWIQKYVYVLINDINNNSQLNNSNENTSFTINNKIQDLFIIFFYTKVDYLCFSFLSNSFLNIRYTTHYL